MTLGGVNRPAPKLANSFRLAWRMIVGVSAGFVVGAATHAVGNAFEPWFCAAPFVYAIVGALIGLCFEVLTRRDEATKREMLLVVAALGLLAIFAALVL